MQKADNLITVRDTAGHLCCHLQRALEAALAMGGAAQTGDQRNRYDGLLQHLRSSAEAAADLYWSDSPR